MTAVFRFVLSLLLAVGAFSTEARAQYLGNPGETLSGHWGTFGVLDSEELFEVGLEYRFTRWRYDIRPIMGVSFLEDGGNYNYLGARYDYALSPEFSVSPSFAVGIYSGGGVDLGGPVEFRSGLDLSYRFNRTWEGAVGFYHLSNAGMYSRNGGSESLLFSLNYTF